MHSGIKNAIQSNQEKRFALLITSWMSFLDNQSFRNVYKALMVCNSDFSRVRVEDATMEDASSGKTRMHPPPNKQESYTGYTPFT